jgi:cytochrome c oxidase assembly protein subunit 15
MKHPTLVRSVAIAAFALCLCVVVLGAYVRLSNAGLGCPDWPGCYGHLTPAAAAADAHLQAAPVDGRALNVGLAWREMVHRYAAGTLATLIIVLAALTALWRRERIVAPWYTAALVAVVVFQATLGALTVTLKVNPLLVTSHLLFGFTTLGLLWWLVLGIWRRRNTAGDSTTVVALPVRSMLADEPHIRRARRLALLALCLLGVQIALGGWTSSNYAAIACPDLPTCQGQWWPPADFRNAFVLWRHLDVDYTGGILDNRARVAIHLTHRLGAIVASLSLLLAVVAAYRQRVLPTTRSAANWLVAALLLQVSIGMSMVVHGFPLWLATAHNAGAALLLLATLGLYRSLLPDS